MQNNLAQNVMNTREIHQALFIDAPPEVVWEAFTDAKHIQNWFAAAAASQPGVDGFIDLIWDRSKPNSGQHCVITEWQPAQRLVMSWRDAPDGEHPLPIEVVLQAKDGGTLFTLTHSGFLSDASWDEEFDSHGRGWTYELKSLRYYVENLFGHTRTIVLQRLPLNPEDWRQLVGPNGAFQIESGLSDRRNCVLGLPGGASSGGFVLNELTQKDVAVVLDVLRGGVLRLTFETFAGEPEVWFWTSSWVLDETALRAIVEPWYQEVKSALLHASADDPQ
ncbi:MAG: SRPBCC domain-containing protein [Pseudomonadota bacterium]